MSEGRIEQRLAALALEFEIPEAPDVAGRVRDRIDAEPAPRSRVRRRAGRPVTIAVIGALVLGGAAFASPLRDDILELLGVEGVEIEVVPELPATEEPAHLGLGDARDAAAAERGAGFRLLRAESGPLSDPHRTFLGTVGGEPIVSYAYPADDGLPEIDAAGTGLVLSQFRPGSDAIFLKKVLAGAEPVRVSVGGVRGYWIGDEHAASLPIEPVDPQASPRLAGHVLIWRLGVTVLRLEADVPRAVAIEMAESVR